jgi:hypothetical protein
MLKSKSLLRKCVFNIARFYFLSETFILTITQIFHIHTKCHQTQVISTFNYLYLPSDFNKNWSRLINFSNTMTNLMKTHFVFFMLHADRQAEILKVQVFWDMKLCHWVSSCWHFYRPQCHYLQGEASLWRKEHYSLSKCQKLHSIITTQRHESWATLMWELKLYCYHEAKRHPARRYENWGCKQDYGGNTYLISAQCL